MKILKIMGKLLGVCILDFFLLKGLSYLIFSEWYQSLFNDPNAAWIFYRSIIKYLTCGLIAGLCIGELAEDLGHKFYLWFLYGQVLTIVPVIHLYMLHKDKFKNFFSEIKECFYDWFTESK